MKRIKELSVFSGNYDWYTKDENGFYVPTEQAPEEAVKAYVENGQQLPTKWIYEKYDLLFKHLVLRYGLDSNRIIKIMKDNNLNETKIFVGQMLKIME